MPARKRKFIGQVTPSSKRLKQARRQETEDQRKLRLEDMRARATTSRASETAEQRELRLADMRARTTAWREKKMICFVPNCSHRREDLKCQFFRFPKQYCVNLRWISLIKSEKCPTAKSHVCSCHFKNGVKQNLPTIFSSDPVPPPPAPRKSVPQGSTFHYCLVKNCFNTTIVTPKKLFFPAPKDESKGNWFRAVKSSYRRNSYCCEDHFDMENDVVTTKVWSSDKSCSLKRKIKPGIVPHIFDCWTKKEENLSHSDESSSELETDGLSTDELTIEETSYDTLRIKTEEDNEDSNHPTCSKDKLPMVLEQDKQNETPKCTFSLKVRDIRTLQDESQTFESPAKKNQDLLLYPNKQIPIQQNIIPNVHYGFVNKNNNQMYDFGFGPVSMSKSINLETLEFEDETDDFMLTNNPETDHIIINSSEDCVALWNKSSEEAAITISDDENSFQTRWSTFQSKNSSRSASSSHQHLSTPSQEKERMEREKLLDQKELVLPPRLTSPIFSVVIDSMDRKSEPNKVTSLINPSDQPAQLYPVFNASPKNKVLENAIIKDLISMVPIKDNGDFVGTKQIVFPPELIVTSTIGKTPFDRKSIGDVPECLSSVTIKAVDSNSEKKPAPWRSTEFPPELCKPNKRHCDNFSNSVDTSVILERRCFNNKLTDSRVKHDPTGTSGSSSVSSSPRGNSLERAEQLKGVVVHSEDKSMKVMLPPNVKINSSIDIKLVPKTKTPEPKDAPIPDVTAKPAMPKFMRKLKNSQTAIYKEAKTPKECLDVVVKKTTSKGTHKQERSIINLKEILKSNTTVLDLPWISGKVLPNIKTVAKNRSTSGKAMIETANQPLNKPQELVINANEESTDLDWDIDSETDSDHDYEPVLDDCDYDDDDEELQLRQPIVIYSNSNSPVNPSLGEGFKSEVETPCKSAVVAISTFRPLSNSSERFSPERRAMRDRKTITPSPVLRTTSRRRINVVNKSIEKGHSEDEFPLVKHRGRPSGKNKNDDVKNAGLEKEQELQRKVDSKIDRRLTMYMRQNMHSALFVKKEFTSISWLSGGRRGMKKRSNERPVTKYEDTLHVVKRKNSEGQKRRKGRKKRNLRRKKHKRFSSRVLQKKGVEKVEKQVENVMGEKLIDSSLGDEKNVIDEIVIIEEVENELFNYKNVENRKMINDCVENQIVDNENVENLNIKNKIMEIEEVNNENENIINDQVKQVDVINEIVSSANVENEIVSNQNIKSLFFNNENVESDIVNKGNLENEILTIKEEEIETVINVDMENEIVTIKEEDIDDIMRDSIHPDIELVSLVDNRTGTILEGAQTFAANLKQKKIKGTPSPLKVFLEHNYFSCVYGVPVTDLLLSAEGNDSESIMSVSDPESPTYLASRNVSNVRRGRNRNSLKSQRCKIIINRNKKELPESEGNQELEVKDLQQRVFIYSRNICDLPICTNHNMKAEQEKKTKGEKQSMVSSSIENNNNERLSIEVISSPNTSQVEDPIAINREYDKDNSSGKTPIVGNIAELTFEHSYASDLDKLSLIHPEKKQCPLCKAWIQNTDYKWHKDCCSSPIFICPECMEEFENTVQFLAHVEDNHASLSKTKIDNALKLPINQCVLNDAVNAICEGALIANVARYFGMPLKYLKKKMQIVGISVRLTLSKQNEILNLMFSLKQKNFKLSIYSILRLAYEFSVLNKPNSLKLANLYWYRNFWKQHPHLDEIVPPLKESSSKIAEVHKYFVVFEEILRTVKVTNDSIFTFGISQKTIKGQLKGITFEKTVKCVFAANKFGDYVAPMYISTDDTSLGIAKESLMVQKFGIMDSDMFIVYLKHFIQHVRPKRKDTILLMVDGRKFYTHSLEAHHLAKQHRIILMSFPKCLDQVQPFHFRFFKVFNNAIDEIVGQTVVQNNHTPLLLKDTYSILSTAFLKCSRPDITRNGFELSGIVPFKRAVIIANMSNDNEIDSQPDTTYLSDDMDDEENNLDKSIDAEFPEKCYHFTEEQQKESKICSIEDDDSLEFSKFPPERFYGRLRQFQSDDNNAPSIDGPLKENEQSKIITNQFETRQEPIKIKITCIRNKRKKIIKSKVRLNTESDSDSSSYESSNTSEYYISNNSNDMLIDSQDRGEQTNLKHKNKTEMENSDKPLRRHKKTNRNLKLGQNSSLPKSSKRKKLKSDKMADPTKSIPTILNNSSGNLGCTTENVLKDSTTSRRKIKRNRKHKSWSRHKRSKESQSHGKMGRQKTIRLLEESINKLAGIVAAKTDVEQRRSIRKPAAAESCNSRKGGQLPSINSRLNSIYSSLTKEKVQDGFNEIHESETLTLKDDQSNTTDNPTLIDSNEILVKSEHKNQLSLIITESVTKECGQETFNQEQDHKLNLSTCTITEGVQSSNIASEIVVKKRTRGRSKRLTLTKNTKNQAIVPQSPLLNFPRKRGRPRKNTLTSDQPFTEESLDASVTIEDDQSTSIVGALPSINLSIPVSKTVNKTEPIQDTLLISKESTEEPLNVTETIEEPTNPIEIPRVTSPRKRGRPRKNTLITDQLLTDKSQDVSVDDQLKLINGDLPSINNTQIEVKNCFRIGQTAKNTEPIQDSLSLTVEDTVESPNATVTNVHSNTIERPRKRGRPSRNTLSLDPTLTEESLDVTVANEELKSIDGDLASLNNIEILIRKSITESITDNLSKESTEEPLNVSETIEDGQANPKEIPLVTLPRKSGRTRKNVPTSSQTLIDKALDVSVTNQNDESIDKQSSNNTEIVTRKTLKKKVTENKIEPIQGDLLLAKEDTEKVLDMLLTNVDEQSKSTEVPASINNTAIEVKKSLRKTQSEETAPNKDAMPITKEPNKSLDVTVTNESNQSNPVERPSEVTLPRKRGRPRKTVLTSDQNISEELHDSLLTNEQSKSIDGAPPNECTEMLIRKSLRVGEILNNTEAIEDNLSMPKEGEESLSVPITDVTSVTSPKKRGRPSKNILSHKTISEDSFDISSTNENDQSNPTERSSVTSIRKRRRPPINTLTFDQTISDESLDVSLTNENCQKSIDGPLLSIDNNEIVVRKSLRNRETLNKIEPSQCALIDKEDAKDVLITNENDQLKSIDGALLSINNTDILVRKSLRIRETNNKSEPIQDSLLLVAAESRILSETNEDDQSNNVEIPFVISHKKRGRPRKNTVTLDQLVTKEPSATKEDIQSKSIDEYETPPPIDNTEILGKNFLKNVDTVDKTETGEDNLLIKEDSKEPLEVSVTSKEDNQSNPTERPLVVIPRKRGRPPKLNSDQTITEQRTSLIGKEKKISNFTHIKDDHSIERSASIRAHSVLVTTLSTSDCTVANQLALLPANEQELINSTNLPADKTISNADGQEGIRSDIAQPKKRMRRGNLLTSDETINRDSLLATKKLPELIVGGVLKNGEDTISLEETCASSTQKKRGRPSRNLPSVKDKVESNDGNKLQGTSTVIGNNKITVKRGRQTKSIRKNVFSTANELLDTFNEQKLKTNLKHESLTGQAVQENLNLQYEYVDSASSNLISNSLEILANKHENIVSELEATISVIEESVKICKKRRSGRLPKLHSAIPDANVGSTFNNITRLRPDSLLHSENELVEPMKQKHSDVEFESKTLNNSKLVKCDENKFYNVTIAELKTNHIVSVDEHAKGETSQQEAPKIVGVQQLDPNMLNALKGSESGVKSSENCERLMEQDNEEEKKVEVVPQNSLHTTVPLMMKLKSSLKLETFDKDNQLKVSTDTDTSEDGTCKDLQIEQSKMSNTSQDTSKIMKRTVRKRRKLSKLTMQKKTSKRKNYETKCLVCSKSQESNWIKCETCKRWSHEACVQLTDLYYYYCDSCITAKTDGDS